ncbi:MAG: D-alanyl-D-alanine carboxypeptidase [Actinobacteria bacterium]|nr:MAG: D-alanyl-D-alanine carboxypeptidase [Actinomycetota bacterium]
MIRIKIFLATLLLLLFPTFTNAAQPYVEASSAILVDGNNGRILWQKNADERRPIASTTKIMTAILTLENTDLSSTAKASKKAFEAGESELALKENESMSVKDLLYGLMVLSANDAAVVLAEKVGGSLSGFAEKMNHKAKKLRMSNTHFVNPNGLHNLNHYSTATDLAKLAVYAEKNEIFSNIVQTKKISVFGAKKYNLENRNKLLWRYSYAVGIKTGYTSQAGYCLVSAAKAKQKFVIAVVLGAPSSDSCFSNSKLLLQYGINNYSYHRIVTANKAFRKLEVPYYFSLLPIGLSQNLGVLAGKQEKVTYKVDLRNDCNLPIKKKEKFGQIKTYVNSDLVAKADLIALKSYKEKSFWQKWKFSVLNLWLRFKNLFKYLGRVG